ncbi:uncharacterized protein CDAR_400271 [Caerostris darwini]|uniref:Gustatory receptor n=1 Tax=Caerostris darwini TaxID=1538125 RepID=A0AAV4VV21_9ARAC|nr:uncharacterized protein CDAR_400271 [Caerostris darwini]
MSQTAWVLIFPDSKIEWATLIVILLQTTAHIYLYRCRHKIQLLLKKLLKISEMCSIHSWKTLETAVTVYCIFSSSVIFACLVIYYNIDLTKYYHFLVNNSTSIPEDLKYYVNIIRDITYLLNILSMEGFLLSINLYYCFVCWCVKLFALKLIPKSQATTVQNDCNRVLQIYQELNNAVKYADSFLSYPAFISVVTNMCELFWTGYNFVFLFDGDYLLFTSLALFLIHDLIILLLIVLSGAAANSAIMMARSTIKSLPAQFPQLYQKIKMVVRQRCKQKNSFTLWKIYTFDKPLLINALGTLLTYGILLGTLGSVRN